jgi:2,3-bisphosphoglycerate-independent phosphoglycerate mutase
MNERKILLLICDGLGDRPVPELHGRTPLQAARKPAIDRIASSAMHGLLYTIKPGFIPGSDTSHLSILGYDPTEFYTGRGPFEALGAGLHLSKGDIAFRCNFATVDAAGKIVDRRAGRIREPETAELASLVTGMQIDGVNVTFRESTEHRCVLVLSGKGLGANVSDTDPGETGSAVLRSEPLDRDSARTAEILNKFTLQASRIFSASEVNRRRMEKNLPPANTVLARSGGMYPELQPFSLKHGMSFGAVAAEGLIKGICLALGAEVVTPPGATAGMDTDLRAKGRAALKMLETNDFVFIHVKPTDVAGHDGNAAGKVSIIERVDGMLNDMLTEIGGDVVFAMTADHSTPVSEKEHTCDPVPLMIYSKGLRSDGISSYDEISAAGGSLNGLRGLDMMPLLKGYAQRNKKYGA